MVDNGRTFGRKKEHFYDKPKHSLPHPEDLKWGVVYAMNWNPKNQPEAIGITARERWNQMYLYMKGILITCTAGAIEGFLEVSSLGRIHFHGKLIISDPDKIAQFYLDDVLRLTAAGTVVIKETWVPDKADSKYASWDAYCSKQAEILKLYRTDINNMLEPPTTKPSKVFRKITRVIDTSKLDEIIISGIDIEDGS